MRTRIGVAAAIASLSALLALSGCWQEKHKWHQKLTVAVETPEGVVSGSAVTRIVANFGEQLMSASEVNYGVTGEATVVEVAPGRFLFALVGGSEERFYRAVRAQLPTSKRGEWLALIPQIEGAVELRPENHPLMVTFDDIADPKTVKRIDPDNLAATFGPGTRLQSVTLEITDEPVTEGKVEEVLGWITTAEYLVPPNQQPRFAKDQTTEQKLMPSDFIDWQTLRDKRKGTQ